LGIDVKNPHVDTAMKNTQEAVGAEKGQKEKEKSSARNNLPDRVADGLIGCNRRISRWRNPK